MKRTTLLVLNGLGLFFVLSFTQPAVAQDNIILQGFYWNTVPGDYSDINNGGVWWDSIALVAPQLKNAGFNVVWTPPAQKGFAGIYDMGYGISDYYDYGQYNQFGTVRTRHGNLVQLQAMINTLKTNSISVMADLVLNHRAGASSQQLEDCDIAGDGRGKELHYTNFTPASGRIAMDSSNFHPTAIHCDLNAEYHNRSFFEDICYFNNINNILNPNTANNGWYFGPHNLGAAGDSLVIVGRHMVDTMHFDMVRLDAVKHIEPGFLAPFLVELKNDPQPQPFAVGELFDGNVATLRSYQTQVESYITTYGTGSKNANMAVFDFSLRYALRDMCNNTGGGYTMSNLNNAGLIFNATPLAGEDVVTFVENHDVDRIGFQSVTCPGGILKIGNTCLGLYTDSGHDPITSDKHMAYAYILGAEGNPTVFWKDYFWYGLDDEIKWLIALRKQFAKGGSTPMSLLSPSGGIYATNDYFVFRRGGTSGGVSDGAMIGLSDKTSGNQDTYVNTPFNNKYLKDYSDGFLFTSEFASADGNRALIRTASRDYSWWAPTGLYPKQAGTAASHFTMNATPGGCPHFVSLKVSDATNFIVNGAPIATGDEVAIKNAAGQIVGIGRIGQGFKWDGTHDMLIEVLGSPSTNGMANGEAFRLFVYDASTNTEIEAAVMQFSPASTAFSFSPDRPNTPNRNGNFAMFSVSTTAGNTFSCNAISRIVAFNTANVQSQQVCGSDIASNSPYNDGWQTNDNGGNNFGTWTLSTTNANAGHFPGSSANNGDGNGDINTSGFSLGMYANSGATANAVRTFLTSLIPGTVFSLKMDNGYLDNNGTVGFGLQNSSGNNLLEFYFRGGQSFYQYNDLNNEQNTTLGFTDDGLTIQITLLTSTTYQLAVTRNGGGSFTTTGTLKNPSGGQAIAQFRLFNAFAGSGNQRDAFFNSFSVCYPATLIINEVDYDQGATDDAEFIELKNVSSSTINMDNYVLELVDGGTGSVYQTIDLPNVNLTSGEYYVICVNNSNTSNCDLDITPNADLIQDGVPDGLFIRLGSLTVDALSYEGNTTNAVETNGAGLNDDGTAARVGLSRVEDGDDTNNNGNDFQLACITPGSANVNSTACPTLSFSFANSTVDEPTSGITTLLISVTLANYLGSPVTVNVSAVGSGANPAETSQDYILNATTLTFNGNETQFIQVSIQPEFMDEDADEFFTINLTITSTNASLGTNDAHVVAITDNAGVLPIELLEFLATPIEKAVLLKWATLTEKNNAYFSIQRSQDAQNWVEIGQAKGHGNTTTLNHYNFTDNRPAAGMNYYRLQQFDMDGHSTLSPIRAAEIDQKAIWAEIFPNPANQQLTINLKTPLNQESQLIIMDMTGRALRVQPLGIGTTLQQLDIANLPKGTYILTLRSENTVQTTRFLKL